MSTAVSRFKSIALGRSKSSLGSYFLSVRIGGSFRDRGSRLSVLPPVCQSSGIRRMSSSSRAGYRAWQTQTETANQPLTARVHLTGAGAIHRLPAVCHVRKYTSLCGEGLVFAE